MGRWGRMIGGMALAFALVAPAAGPSFAQDPDAPEALRAEAFEAAQWAIASDAADALAQVSARFARGDDALGRLAEERQTLATHRAGLERQMERLYSAEGAADQSRRDTLRTEFETVLARLQVLDTEIETRFPAYAELTSPRALSVEETQALLKPDEGLLLVLVASDAAYVWAVTREDIAWTRAAGLGETAMGEAVETLRRSLAIPDVGRGTRGQDVDPGIFAGREAEPFDRATAHRLYSELVAPVEGILGGKTRLITVVTGALSALPPAVLVTAPPRGRDADPEALAQTGWLVDRYALASLPAVSSLKALRCDLVRGPERHPGCAPIVAGAPGQGRAPRTASGITLAAFGAPTLAGAPRSASRSGQAAEAVMGPDRLADVARLRALPSLPGSLKELQALKMRYPRGVVRTGAAATETAVRVGEALALSRARVVVFSTHGLMAGSSVAEPGLVLTPPDDASIDDDGYLSASEVAGLRLRAEFVVLSACDTASSNGSASGGAGADGLSGLARAFFYAGARSVLVSHWAVSDEATTELVGETFSALDTPGADLGDRAQALRVAMTRVRAERRWRHPAYWAPFTLVGEPG